MSRTLRLNNETYRKILNNEKNHRSYLRRHNKKLRPYVFGWYLKDTVEPGGKHLPKLKMRNSNRYKKKRLRQHLLRELRKEIDAVAAFDSNY